MKAGLSGLHLVAQAPDAEWNPSEHGFDAATILFRLSPPPMFIQRLRRKAEKKHLLGAVIRRLISKPLHVYHYRKAIKYFVKHNVNWEYYPMVLPNWDNTPRSGRDGVVLVNSTPELFRYHLRDALAAVQGYATNHRILFLKSWNEWAEGNHLEPDIKFGYRYLEVIRDEITESSV